MPLNMGADARCQGRRLASIFQYETQRTNNFAAIGISKSEFIDEPSSIR